MLYLAIRYIRFKGRPKPKFPWAAEALKDLAVDGQLHLLLQTHQAQVFRRILVRSAMQKSSKIIKGLQGGAPQL